MYQTVIDINPGNIIQMYTDICRPSECWMELKYPDYAQSYLSASIITSDRRLVGIEKISGILKVLKQ